MRRIARIGLPNGKTSLWLYSRDGKHATCLSTKDTPLDLSLVPDDEVRDGGLQRELVALTSLLVERSRPRAVQRHLRVAPLTRRHRE